MSSMKNLPRIPDAIISTEDKAFLCWVADENSRVVQPSKVYQRFFATLDRLAGAYLDCLQDRDEWKELGEAVQRKQRQQEQKQTKRRNN